MKEGIRAIESIVVTRGMTAIRILPVMDKTFFSSDETDLIRDLMSVALEMGIRVHTNCKTQVVYESIGDLKEKGL